VSPDRLKQALAPPPPPTLKSRTRWPAAGKHPAAARAWLARPPVGPEWEEPLIAALPGYPARVSDTSGTGGGRPSLAQIVHLARPAPFCRTPLPMSGTAAGAPGIIDCWPGRVALGSLAWGCDEAASKGRRRGMDPDLGSGPGHEANATARGAER
jgi:hypothetical protein